LSFTYFSAIWPFPKKVDVKKRQSTLFSEEQMTTKKRTYPAELKQETVRLWETSGKSAMEIERELGITHGLLNKWKRQLKMTARQPFLAGAIWQQNKNRYGNWNESQPLRNKKEDIGLED
jgi:transposase-like protein